MKILIMGLPGSGKTYIAERLQKQLECAWYNADQVRTMANDWDFSDDGRLRQAARMRAFADFENNNNRTVICDFVAPVKAARESFDADIIIWMDTIHKGRFEDTNKMFEPPMTYNFKIDVLLSDEEIWSIGNDILQKH